MFFCGSFYHGTWSLPPTPSSASGLWLVFWRWGLVVWSLFLSPTQVLWQEPAPTIEDFVKPIWVFVQWWWRVSIPCALLRKWKAFSQRSDHGTDFGFSRNQVILWKICSLSREIRFCYGCGKSNPFVLQVVLVCTPLTTLKINFHLKSNVLNNIWSWLMQMCSSYVLICDSELFIKACFTP